MRLKTTPRQRRVNYSRTPTNARQEHRRLIGITQDVNEEFLDNEKYGQMVGGPKKPEGKEREVPKAANEFDPTQHEAEKYSQKNSCVLDSEIPTKDICEAVNLSTKNGSTIDSKYEPLDGSITAECASGDDKFAGSILYQIMTDPTFVDNIKNNKEMKKLTCKFCKKKFSNYGELLDHLDARLDEFDRITCCACRKTFGQKRYLRYHQRCHVMNDKFTCEICMKSYSRMDNLTRHRTYHTNPDKYPCKICEKKFSRRDLMTKHSKSHEGKKITCHLCKQVFIDSAKIKAHQLACAKQTRETETTHIED